MAITKKNVADFADIFNFAKDNYGIDWNTCCDIFHRGAILCNDEGKDRDLDLEEIKMCLEDDLKHKYYSKEQRQGWEIVVSYMEKEGVEEMRVEND